MAVEVSVGIVFFCSVVNGEGPFESLGIRTLFTHATPSVKLLWEHLHPHFCGSLREPP